MCAMVRASGGYSKKDVDDAAAAARVGDAVAANVLSGKTFTNSTASGLTGSMVDRGSSAVTLSGRNSTVTEQAGYYGQHTISVAAPSSSSKKVLTAEQYGDVDLTPYDYKYVNAAAVRTGGYNAGMEYVLGHLGFYSESGSDHIAGNGTAALTQVSNTTSVNKWVIVTASIAKRSDYDSPGIQIDITGSYTNIASSITTTYKKDTNDNVRTYIETITKAVIVPAGGEINISLTENEGKNGVYTYAIEAISLT